MLYKMTYSSYTCNEISGDTVDCKCIVYMLRYIFQINEQCYDIERQISWVPNNLLPTQLCYDFETVNNLSIVNSNKKNKKKKKKQQTIFHRSTSFG